MKDDEGLVGHAGMGKDKAAPVHAHAALKVGPITDRVDGLVLRDLGKEVHK